MDGGELMDRLQLVVSDRPGERCVRALVGFDPEEAIAQFWAADVCKEPSRMTLQVAMEEHIEIAPTVLQYVNHSCMPNAFFDTQRGALVALLPIVAKEEITFFYPSTEWTMASPFDCRCKQLACVGRIAGASRMSRKRLAAYRLARHVERLLAPTGVTRESLFP
jgi:SET domain